MWPLGSEAWGCLALGDGGGLRGTLFALASLWGTLPLANAGVTSQGPNPVEPPLAPLSEAGLVNLLLVLQVPTPASLPSAACAQGVPCLGARTAGPARGAPHILVIALKTFKFGSFTKYKFVYYFSILKQF